MDEDRLPAEPATVISTLILRFCFFTDNNIFTLSKKQQKCNVSEEKKDGNEYNAFDFLLFA